MTPERPETPPRNEKGRDVHKPEMDPRKETPDRKEIDPNWGIPDSTHLPTEDQPSPQMKSARESQEDISSARSNMAKGQSDFMKPERADRDSNEKSGAL